jgi:glycerate kinase
MPILSAPSSGSTIIVIAPDSFKGSLGADAVARAIGAGVRRALPEAELRLCPMADGGEGTLDAILRASKLQRRVIAVHGASGARVEAAVAVLGDKAIIEIAQVVGLTDGAATAVDVMARDTRGVGELIVALLDTGCRNLMIGLGGSSTNDGGAGLLVALGVRLRDAAGASVAPTPKGLARLATVDVAGLDPRLAQCSITIMSDVDNPLTGERGATAVFGPQKGVAAAAVAEVDAVLGRFATRIEDALGRSVQALAGSGAAGGLGFALQLLGARFRSGADVVADAIGLDRALTGAAWAITGEGRSDAQTAMRKAPWVVAERASAQGVAVSLLSGALDASALPLLHRHFAGCFALPPGPQSLSASIAHAHEWLADRAEAMARLRFG